MNRKYTSLIFVLFSVTVISAQTLDASLLELAFSNDGYPERFTKTDNGFYFTADDDELWFTDGTTEGTRIFALPVDTYGDVRKIVPFGNKVFFDAAKNSRSDELWVSDGTEAGTIQLTNRDLSFSQDGTIRSIGIYNDKIYFSLFDELYGTELWITDGTIEGTALLVDINQGADSSNPSNFFVFNDKLFFTAFTEEFGTELWSTDGTQEGTSLLKDISSGTQRTFSVTSLLNFIKYGENFYFFADNGINGFELWRSDGTSDGTVLFKDINENPGNSSSSIEMIGGVVNNTLMFLADDGQSGRELWISDGTETGTKILKDIAPDLRSGFPFGTSTIIFLDSKAFFNASDNAEKTGLWVSDGTPDGTVFVKQIETSYLTHYKNQESVVFFGLGSNSRPVLWKSDGTPQGTQFVSEKATATNISSHKNDIITIDDRVFFAAETENNGIELWVSDGTDEGTSLFIDLNKRFGASPSILTKVKDRVFFRANQFGTFQLATSDGTVNGTTYLDINIDGGSIDEESEFIEFNGKLVVSANDGVHGFEPWISDGTQEGTYMLKDINLGGASSQSNNRFVQNYTVIGEKLYFMADDGVYGNELWSTDGTEEGTFRVTNIAQGTRNNFSSNPQNLVNYNGFIYFSAGDGNGSALYRTDGSSGNWTEITRLNRLESIYVVNNRLVMVADTSGSSFGPRDLWVSDGTSSGTQQIESFGSGIDSNIQFLTVLNDELYFVANYPFFGTGTPPFFGKSIYKTDGTQEGTVPLFVGSEHPIINPDIDNLFTCGDYVYFGIQESLGNFDRELWRTDGTTEGTVQIAVPTGNFDGFSGYGCFNNSLFYIDTSDFGTLRLTNGDPNEQYEFVLSDINGAPLEISRSLGNLTQVDDKLFFTGITERSGNELYTSFPLRISASEDIADSDADGVVDFFDECPNTEEGLTVNELGCAENQLDDDKDGVTNDIDLCPDTAIGMTVDSNGCDANQSADNDGDGVNNLEDLCSDTPTDEAVDGNGCSASQLDDDEDGIANNVDLCPSTPLEEEVDSNGCGQSQLDDDNDGVSNDIDLCLETNSDMQVSPNGCNIVPNNAIQVYVLTPSCTGSSDGSVEISMNIEDYLLDIVIDGENFSGQFNDIPSASTFEINDLPVGVYTVTISIPEILFRQTYGVNVDELSSVSGKRVSLNLEKRTASYSVKGSQNYTVAVNDKRLNFTFENTAPQTIMIQDLSDQNEVVITGENDCQGKITDSFFLGNAIQVFPTITFSELNIQSSSSQLDVFIYGLNGKMVKQERLSGHINSIDISSLESGIYILRMVNEANDVSIKIVKR